MKKALKLTAAALAAISALSCTVFAVSAEDADASFVQEDIPLSGGWTVNDSYVAMSKNPEAKAAFKKATKDYAGWSFKALALLGTQVVAGTNYAILVKADELNPDGGATQIKVMYIYEDLKGNAEITGFQTIIGEQLMGGFTANSGLFTISKNETVYSAYKKAMKELVGVSYSPVAYLGSQIVSGTNYLVLCRSKGVYPGASYGWSLVTIYSNLNGDASVGDIQALDLGNMDNTGDNMTVSIGNPWTEYKSVEEAAKAAGVTFEVPEKFGSYKISYIQAMEGIAEVRFSNGDDTITVRKGTGVDDISGDYNEYKSISEKEINGSTATLKGSGKGVSAAVWTDGKCSYSVVSDRALTAKSMESIISKIK
ncbi:MAG TPA: hypothetical protein DDX72_01505 [Ruminococcaceae bacterium]|nr:hypothetical protein [Oscillospiraceae bacterium]